jgi:hypothetical protein
MCYKNSAHVYQCLVSWKLTVRYDFKTKDDKLVRK